MVASAAAANVSPTEQGRTVRYPGTPASISPSSFTGAPSFSSSSMEPSSAPAGQRIPVR